MVKRYCKPIYRRANVDSHLWDLSEMFPSEDSYTSEDSYIQPLNKDEIKSTWVRTFKLDVCEGCCIVHHPADAQEVGKGFAHFGMKPMVMFPALFTTIQELLACP